MEEIKLTSTALKLELWRALLGVRDKKISPAVANAIAVQARELMRIVKTEMDIIGNEGNSIQSKILPLE